MSRSSRARRTLVAAACITGIHWSHDALAVSKTWVGSNGLWSGAANWSPANQPGAGDVVFLNQGAALFAFLPGLFLARGRRQKAEKLHASLSVPTGGLT